jgi:ppGpp synthetase/RelA/SpoT-type nucleotidyltranferase
LAKTLEQEALERLRGTHGVVDQLHGLLNAGTPSINDLAYAVKARVKDDFKIVEKVTKKRLTKPGYGVPSVRDVIGLRIVTLYRLDALAIVPVLLDRIAQTSGPDETNLFLDNPVEEIKIYSVNPGGDAQNLPNRLLNVFEDRGYRGRAVIEQTPQNYSSTHIVVWTRGKWNDAYRHIPVEIQIRTALEDVWGEIDHKLKYKRDLDADLGYHSAAMIENCLAHLNVMKTLNDGLAQYGDQVKIQIDEIDESVRRKSRSRLAEEAAERLKSFSVYSGDVKDRVEAVLGRTREILGKNPLDAHFEARKLTGLRAIAEEFEVEEILSDFSYVQDESFISELRYVLTMELALIEFEIGKRLGKAAGNAHLIRAQEAYMRMEQAYSGRGIVQYRLARVLYALGDHELARDRMANLLENYSDYDLPASHWVHASASRILGFWHWDKVATNRTRPSSFASEADQLEFLERTKLAVKYSANATKIVVENERTPDEVPHESDRVMSVSNTIYFIVEFLEAGGKWDDLVDIDMDAEKLKALTQEVSQFDENSVADFHKVNTLRRAFAYLNDLETAKKFAFLVLKNLEQAGFHDRGGKTVEEHVIRQCRDFLAKQDAD